MKFELVVIRKTKGFFAAKVCELTRYADSVSEAVRLTRMDVGGELIVLQKKAWQDSLKQAAA